ncbi:hypothetical protein SK128_000284 [Halocaridina rubra]|uniref:Uncharacterized protein n=1 Tax=Halocaridina rubra TaxID=373956 RepID=A0AAN8X2H5_HALRR
MSGKFLSELGSRTKRERVIAWQRVATWDMSSRGGTTCDELHRCLSWRVWKDRACIGNV